MPISIKNREVDRLIDEITELTGESKTEAVRQALMERKARRDSSALLAIIFREDGWQTLLDVLEASPGAAAGTPTLAETGIVRQARLAGEPLLCVGEDLGETDLEVA